MQETAATLILSATPPDPDDLVEHSAAELLEMRKLATDFMTKEEQALLPLHANA